MQIVIETDEAWSLMSVITSYVIDKSGVSQDGKQAIRKWRTDRAAGTVEMDALTVALNEAIGTHIDKKMARKVHTRGRYISTTGR
jgi:hypothetical protein